MLCCVGRQPSTGHHPLPASGGGLPLRRERDRRKVAILCWIFAGHGICVFLLLLSWSFSFLAELSWFFSFCTFACACQVEFQPNKDSFKRSR